MVVTLKMLIHQQSTLTQLAILSRADRILPCGRYYGGLLTPEDVDYLVNR